MEKRRGEGSQMSGWKERKQTGGWTAIHVQEGGEVGGQGRGCADVSTVRGRVRLFIHQLLRVVRASRCLMALKGIPTPDLGVTLLLCDLGQGCEKEGCPEGVAFEAPEESIGNFA